MVCCFSGFACEFSNYLVLWNIFCILHKDIYKVSLQSQVIKPYMWSHVNFKPSWTRITFATPFIRTYKGSVPCVSQHMRGEMAFCDELFIALITLERTWVSVSAQMGSQIATLWEALIAFVKWAFVASFEALLPLESQDVNSDLVLWFSNSLWKYLPRRALFPW